MVWGLGLEAPSSCSWGLKFMFAKVWRKARAVEQQGIGKRILPCDILLRPGCGWPSV